ncbi:MAG: class I SAM-dependent methyltransferase [Bacteroidota bacterium]
MSKLRTYLNDHHYPALLWRRPRLLRVIHWLTAAVTLRSWHVHPELRRLARSLPPGFVWMDAGCGAGEFLVPLAHAHRTAAFVGIDRSEHNVAIGQAYAEAAGRSNLTYRAESLEALPDVEAFDAVSCIGVLQYTEGQAAVVSRLARSLRPGGVLALYVPVHEDRLLPFFRRWMQTYFGGLDYNEGQGQHGRFTPRSTRALVEQAGLQIERQRSTYGFFGKLNYETYTLWLHAAQRSPVWLQPLLVAVGIVAYPLWFMLMLADIILPIRRGNGLLVIARKPAATDD